MKRKFAGIDVRDLDRMADGVALSLVDEVVSFVRKHTKLANSVDLFLVIDEISTCTGATDGEVQDAFDIAYQDHRIMIDKDGFVKLVNKGKRRSRSLKTKLSRRQGALGRMVSRFKHPDWVQDPTIWKQAVMECDISDDSFWGKVVVEYRKRGGRLIRVKSKTAEFKVRPFDVHPIIWSVSSDGVLDRCIKDVQGFIADGADPEDLEEDMVTAGFELSAARKLIYQALASNVII